MARRVLSPNRKVLQISLEQKRMQKDKDKDEQPTSPRDRPTPTASTSSPSVSKSTELEQSPSTREVSFKPSESASEPTTPHVPHAHSVAVPILDLVSSKKKRDKKDKKKDKVSSASLTLEDMTTVQKLRSKKKHSKSLLSPTKSEISPKVPALISLSPRDAEDFRSSSAIAPPLSGRDRSPIRISFGRSRASSFSTSVSSLPGSLSTSSNSWDAPLDSPRDPDVFLELLEDDFEFDSMMYVPRPTQSMNSARPLLQQTLERRAPDSPKSRHGVRARSNSLAIANPAAITAANVAPVRRSIDTGSPQRSPVKRQAFQTPTSDKSRRASFGTVSPEYLLEMLNQMEDEEAAQQNEVQTDSIRRPNNKRLSLRSELNLLPLMKVCKGWWVELGDKAVSSRTMEESEYLDIFNSSTDVHFYKHYFSGNDHQNYIGFDEKVGPFLLSVVREKSAFQQNSKLIRTLLRTKKGDDRKCIQEKLFTKGSKSKASVNQIMKAIAPGYSRSKVQLIKPSSVVEDLITFEEKQMVHAYKFGVLYCQEGQTREEEMFSNENGSADFDEFLALLGDTVTMKGFSQYRGGLDNQLDMTGTESVYTKYRDYEIMFHVSTMLPYSFDNPQQLERKRHLGNDIVVVVFKEGNTPYVPSCISSDFNHVVAVVSAIRQDGKLYYRLSVASKDGVPTFTPQLPDPALFEAGPKFRDILLCKRTQPSFSSMIIIALFLIRFVRAVINGERASLRAPSFAEKIGRTRYVLLKDLEEKYLKL